MKSEIGFSRVRWIKMKSNGFSDKLDGFLFHLGKILFFEVLIYPINQIRFIFRIFHKTPRVHFNPNDNLAFEIEIRSDRQIRHGMSHG